MSATHSVPAEAGGADSRSPSGGTLALVIETSSCTPSVPLRQTQICPVRDTFLNERPDLQGDDSANKVIIVIDPDGTAPDAEKGTIVRMHGQNWRVTHVGKTVGGKDEFVVYKIYLART